MAEFNWEATNRAGEYRSGVMTADAAEDVRSRLVSQGLVVTGVKKKPLEINLPTIGSGVKLRDLVIFTRTFSTMIDAGLPIVQCLDMLSGQTDNRHFGKVLADVKNGVESGRSLSDSMGTHPKVFDDLFRNLVGAGEAGGILDLIFRRLAQYLEKADKLRRQVRGAMIYPTAIVVVGVLVMTVMMTFVLPTFEDMFKDLGAGSLPAPTRFVLSLSHFVVDNLMLIIGATIISAMAFTAAVRTDAGKYWFHMVLLKMPVVGPVVRKGAVARFTRTLGTLLASGVPILDSLEIVANTSGNEVIKRGIMHAREKVAEGRDLASPLMATAIFPPMVVQMIGVGERTGAMDEMLQKIADFYEDEVDQAVNAMTALIEPIILVFLGGGVGGMLIAMYLPIFELAGGIK